MNKHNYYPAGLNVQGKQCLVIGDDREAAEKFERLRDAGALVLTVAPKSFSLSQLTDQFFVVLCVKTDPALTRAVARECRKKRILLCAIDQPEFCDIVNLSIFDKGRLRITIGTGGAAPAISKKIRLGLESSLKDSPIDEYLDDLAALRERLEGDKERIPKLLEAADGFEFQATVRFPPQWMKKRKDKHENV